MKSWVTFQVLLFPHLIYIFIILFTNFQLVCKHVFYLLVNKGGRLLSFEGDFDLTSSNEVVLNIRPLGSDKLTTIKAKLMKHCPNPTLHSAC